MDQDERNRRWQRAFLDAERRIVDLPPVPVEQRRAQWSKVLRQTCGHLPPGEVVEVAILLAEKFERQTVIAVDVGSQFPGFIERFIKASAEADTEMDVREQMETIDQELNEILAERTSPDEEP